MYTFDETFNILLNIINYYRRETGPVHELSKFRSLILINFLKKCIEYGTYYRYRPHVKP